MSDINAAAPETSAIYRACQALEYGVVIVALVLFSGCNNPKDVSKANFEKIINEKLKGQKLCVQPQSGLYRVRPYPVTIPTRVSEVGMDAFVGAGLLSTSATTTDIGSLGGPPVPGTTFSLTEKGKQSYAGPPKFEFCYGVAEATKIEEFTEPADMFGAHITRVTFVAGVHDRADWSSDQGVQKLYRIVKPGSQGVAVLELTSEGWRVRETSFSNK